MAMEEKDGGRASFDHIQFLVVDDHAFVRQIVTECLKKYDVKRCASAQDGGEALTLLASLGRRSSEAQISDIKPASGYCVISDFKMPKVNGLELLKAIRCGDAKVARDTPFILLTGYSDDWVVTTALQLDVGGFVLKPVAQSALWTRIQRVLKVKSEIKPAASYRAVGIPGDTAERSAAALANTSRINLNDKDIKWVALANIRPGDLLARDIYGEGGILVQAGVTFSESVLQKLADLEKMSAFSGPIAVQPGGDPGARRPPS